VGPNGEFSKKKSTTEYTPWFGNKGVFLRGNSGITNKTQNMNSNVNMDLAKPLDIAYQTGKGNGFPINSI
jgi:hypothetical protein